MTINRLTGAAVAAALLAGPAVAQVTVLGWPGGPEEAALRAAAEMYNAREDVADEDKVELLFTSRDGFFDKLQVDLAAGSTAFDANLIATYSIGRYAPFMEPITLSDEAGAVFGDTVLSTMQFDGQQYGVPTDLSLHFLYYRSDLIEALMADEAAVEVYGDISEEYLGERLAPKSPEGIGTWDDFRRHALYFKPVGEPRQAPRATAPVLQMKNLLFKHGIWVSFFFSTPPLGPPPPGGSYGADWMDARRTMTDGQRRAWREGAGDGEMLY